MKLLVTGGAGFIGSCFVQDWLAHEAEPLVVFDALTYAGSLYTLAALQQHLPDAPLHQLGLAGGALRLGALALGGTAGRRATTPAPA